MIEVIGQMFTYSFIIRALIAGGLVALCASMLGVCLVLKRYAMIGDGLSHVGFGALAVATAMNWAPLEVTIPVVVAAAFLLLRVSDNSKIRGDSAIAMISTGALAVGIIIASKSTGMNTDIYSYLFGSILAMSRSDIVLSIVISVAVLGLFICFYNRIFAVTFDENFAKATGTDSGIYNMLIAFLTAMTVVLGMRMMGALLISSMIIFPALTAMRLCKSFKSVMICSAVVSVVCVFIGVFVSFVYSTPTGASIVAINIVLFLIFSVVKFIKTLGIF